MATKIVLDSTLITDKENMRKNIRVALANRSTTKFSDSVSSVAGLQPVSELTRSFVSHYRAAGGKYIPCSKTNLIPRLIQLLKSQKYFNVLNTNPNMKPYLDKNRMHYTDSINLADPVDAAIVYSDMLIARNGSVGFAQCHTLYPSVKNLAKDLIIVSSTRFIYSDMEQAMIARCKSNAKMATSMVEFLRPEQPEKVNEIVQYSPWQPRFILMMLDEENNAAAEPVPAETPDTKTSDSANPS